MDDHLHLDSNFNGETSEFTDQEFRKFLTGRQGNNVNRPYTYQVGSVFQCPVWVDLGDKSLTDITSNLLVRGLDSDIPIQLQLRISLQCLFAPLIIIAVCVFLGVVIISLLCFCIKKKRVPAGLNNIVHDNFNRNARTRKIHYHERPAFDQIPVIENTPTIQNISKSSHNRKPYQLQPIAENRNESNSTSNSQRILFPSNNVNVIRTKSGKEKPLFGQPRNERRYINELHEPSTSIGTHRISRNYQTIQSLKREAPKKDSKTRKFVHKDIISFI